ncbi:MAG TPA: hypothetical protein EYP86_00415 [Candidatus Altiarchaeales archaeon]|nr:hypothetical protein [Candidatus Altiarchaeales archaeon]
MKLEFFGRIFKAKRSKTEPFEVIDIDSLRDLLEDELEKEKSEILRECKSLFSEIKTGVERIQSIANRISESKIPEDIPKKIYKAAVTSKPAFINGILNSVGPFKGYKLSNFDDIEKFHKTLESSLSDIAKISVSKGRYLPVVFGEEMEQIRRESKYLLNKSKEI